MPSGVRSASGLAFRRTIRIRACLQAGGSYQGMPSGMPQIRFPDAPLGAELLMRYLVRARLKPNREADLLQAIEDETLGQGSVAGREYLRNMSEARLCPDQTVRWVEVCYCPTPLEEERPYWEQYFDLTKV